MKSSVQRKINNFEKSEFHLEFLNNKILKINKNRPFHPSSSTRRLPSLLSSPPLFLSLLKSLGPRFPKSRLSLDDGGAPRKSWRAEDFG